MQVLPALRSFCVFCAVGILLVYVLQTSVFVAALTRDTKRIEERKNGFLVCYTHSEEWEPNAFSRKNFLQTGFGEFYAPNLVKSWSKVRRKGLERKGAGDVTHGRRNRARVRGGSGHCEKVRNFSSSFAELEVAR